jgi:hypothetical protein
MQSTIIHPPEPLGAKDATMEQHNEVATKRNGSIPSIKSSVAPGGTLMLTSMPISTGNNNDRNLVLRLLG